MILVAVLGFWLFGIGFGWVLHAWRVEAAEDRQWWIDHHPADGDPWQRVTKGGVKCAGSVPTDPPPPKSPPCAPEPRVDRNLISGWRATGGRCTVCGELNPCGGHPATLP